MKKHPDRFAAFATLPMVDSTEAAKELERCVKEYGFVGALITGTYQGKFYDDPMFFPIFEKAAELDVPISWHPEFPAAQIQTHYYSSDNYPLSTGMQFATAGFGWHLDVGLHMTRLVPSGIFDKLPNLVHLRTLGRCRIYARPHGSDHAARDNRLKEGISVFPREYLVHTQRHPVKRPV